MSELADASGESGPDPPTRRCHVLPHPINARAMQSDIESFRLLCNTHAVETVFTVHQSRLDGAFAHFATGRGGAEVEMDLEQWLRFMEAARLCDEGLSVEVSTLLYSMIQTDENPRLSYAEFQQVFGEGGCTGRAAVWCGRQCESRAGRLLGIFSAKSPRREVVRSSAGAGVVSPLFGGHLRSIPQRVVSDVQPLVKSFFCPIRRSSDGFFDSEASIP